METYEIKDNNLIITIPIMDRRWNPYDPEQKLASALGDSFMRLVGYIDNKISQYGFGFFIDRDFKNKGDDDTGLIFPWLGSQDDFEKFCREHKISIILK